MYDEVFSKRVGDLFPVDGQKGVHVREVFPDADVSDNFDCYCASGYPLVPGRYFRLSALYE